MTTCPAVLTEVTGLVVVRSPTSVQPQRDAGPMVCIAVVLQPT